MSEERLFKAKDEVSDALATAYQMRDDESARLVYLQRALHAQERVVALRNAIVDSRPGPLVAAIKSAECDECFAELEELLENFDRLEFFTAILLAVSVNRAANLEALETFIKDLHNAATSR